VSTASCVLVIEANRVAAQRVGRVLSAACGAQPAVLLSAASELPEELPGPPLLIAADAASLPAVRELLRRFPSAQPLLWATADLPTHLASIRDDARFRAVLAWPSFASMPRPWELALAARRLTDPMASVPKLVDLLAFGAHVQRWRPRTSADRDEATEAAGALVEACGVNRRVADRVGEVVHELLMNAMYDAPVDGWGQARYAADRRAEVTLDDAEVPTLRVGFDGVLIGVEIQDPFGRLRDEHVLDGVLRGAANQAADGGAPVLDTRHGGAGLGMARVHGASTALIVDVRPLEATRLLWFFDADTSARDTRGMPSSLHLYRSDPGDRGSRS